MTAFIKESESVAEAQAAHQTNWSPYGMPCGSRKLDFQSQHQSDTKPTAFNLFFFFF